MPPSPPPIRTRHLLVAVAFLLLFLFMALGITYLQISKSASIQIARFLPANTLTFIQSERPLQQLLHSLQKEGKEAGFNALFPNEKICADCGLFSMSGLPPNHLKELIQEAQHIEMAWVPDGKQHAFILFLNIPDKDIEGRLWARLQPHLETAYRESGFRIDQAKVPYWKTLLPFPSPEPFITTLEPWIVLHWGSISALQQVLKASIAGNRNSLARRIKLPLPNSEEAQNPQDFHLVSDLNANWNALQKVPPSREGLIKEFDMLHLFSPRKSEEESLLTLDILNREKALYWTQLFQPGPHDLMRELPKNAAMGLSFRARSLKAFLKEVGTLTLRFEKDLAKAFPIEFEGLMAKLQSLNPSEALQPMEIVFALLMPKKSAAEREFLVLLRSEALDEAEALLKELLQSFLGDNASQGELYLRKHPYEGPVFLKQSEQSTRAFAWARLPNALILASSLDALKTFQNASLRQEALPSSAESDIFAFFSMAFLEESQPRLALISQLQKNQDPLPFKLSFGRDKLYLQSPFKIWSLLASLLETPFLSWQESFPPTQDKACQEAYLAYCKAYPKSLLCQPLLDGLGEALDSLCPYLQFSSPPSAQSP